ncbi:DUF883 family protein [Zoogloea dura]|uniref:DUF883 family protein n=1 Tax=Zoogloea dura TaxID=2728840 RepID=UPI00145D5F90|nr:DUF883 family protein [Zoogloea dura]
MMSTESSTISSTIPASGESRKDVFVKDLKGVVGSADDLITDMAQTTAEGYAAARSTVQGAMGEARSRYDDVRRRALHQAHCATEATQTYMREKPWHVLAGAAVLGFLAGVFINRR